MFKRQDDSEKTSAHSNNPTKSTDHLADYNSSSAVTKRSGSSVIASIGPSIKINGDITGNENLVVNGELSGSISLPNHMLTIGKEGSVDADITAKTVDIEGCASGTVNASELVRVKPSGSVNGDISAPRVVLEDGSHFKGGIDMKEKVIADTSKQQPGQIKDNVSTTKAAIPNKSNQDQLFNPQPSAKAN